MAWSTHIVADHPVDLFTPSSARFTLLFLHDADGRTLLNSPEWTSLLEAAGMVCVCPHGNQSWWSNRICRDFNEKQSAEQYVIANLLPWIQQSWKCGLAVAGIGMGGQGALRLAFKYPQLFPVVGAIDAAIDHHELHGSGTALDELYESREQCRQDSAPLHIHPSKQPRHVWFAVDSRSRWFRGNDRLHEKLAALGVSHKFEVNPSMVQAEPLLKFLVQGLEEQSRRLL